MIKLNFWKKEGFQERNILDKTMKEPFKFRKSINFAHDFVQIPGLNKVISKYEVGGLERIKINEKEDGQKVEFDKGMSWYEGHRRLQEKGLYMPTITEFISHFKNVVKAYHSKGKNPLFDAEGNPISWKETKSIYNNLTKEEPLSLEEIRSYDGGIFLDTIFMGGSGLESTIYIGNKRYLDEYGKEEFIAQIEEPLKKCIMNPGFVDFSSFDSLGMPQKKSTYQQYSEGKNIYFFPPGGTGSGDGVRF